MPEGLRLQIPEVREYLDRAGVSWLRLDGEEADDLLATLAVKGARDGNADVLLATSDKDLYQLVDDTVRIVSVSGEGGSMGAAEVMAKTGVEPAQVVDWLSLTGDAADNIPGVPGIGPKTAARILREFGSLESVWRRLEEVRPERIRSLLDEHRSNVERNVDVVRLDTHAGCEADWDAWRVKAGDHRRLAEFFDRMEFKSLAHNMRQPDLFEGA